MTHCASATPCATDFTGSWWPGRCRDGQGELLRHALFAQEARSRCGTQADEVLSSAPCRRRGTGCGRATQPGAISRRPQLPRRQVEAPRFDAAVPNDDRVKCGPCRGAPRRTSARRPRACHWFASPRGVAQCGGAPGASVTPLPVRACPSQIAHRDPRRRHRQAAGRAAVTHTSRIRAPVLRNARPDWSPARRCGCNRSTGFHDYAAPSFGLASSTT